MSSNQFCRLPRSCLPLHYAIEFKPCMETFTYTGKQCITVQVEAGTSEIVLNAKGLGIISATFNGCHVKVIPEPDQEKIRFQLSKPHQGGKTQLDIEFKGEVSEKMKGFYKSKYTSDKEEKVMLVTHFEPTNARLAFPCWDEPDFKSIFSIKFIVPKKLTAISNMPLASKVESDGGCVAYLFEDTPKMSTYLVAFAVGEFEYVEAVDPNGVLVHVYSRQGMVSESGRGELALDVTCRALPFFGDYFGTRYPLPKVDLLAIPDFAGGAMENWGLITFRERTLLVETMTASPSSKQLVALVVSHELAHMWFGNLVTMHWWTDLWLKEGFASWIEYLCVNHCFPDWEIWNHFTYDQMSSALRLDALQNSHPIEVEVNNPDEIEEIFDTISYCKGASVIRMLHAYLGDKAFRAGLCAYLAKHAYGNAVTEDLWTALSSVSQVDVANLMRRWTNTAGFPVVKITPLAVKNGFISVRLEQMQYQLPSSESRTSSSLQWTIPIEFTCHCLEQNSTSVHKYLLDGLESVVDIPVSCTPTSLSDFIVQLNAEATCLYRVCYSDEQFDQFIKHFHSLPWTIPGKIAFFNDAFALAKSYFISIHKWLKCLPLLLSGEKSYTIWRCVLVDGLSTYVHRLVHEGGISLTNYHSFLRKLVRPTLDCLAFVPSDSNTSLSHDAQLLRSLLVITAGAEAGDGDVIAEAKRRFDGHRQGQHGSSAAMLSGDLRLAVLSTVVRHGDSSDILDYLMKLYPTIQSPDEQSSVLSAICSAKEGPALDSALKFCLDRDGSVRNQDRVQGLLTCASWSTASRLATWQAMKANWDWLTSIYHGQFLMSSLLEGLLSGFATEQHVDDVNNFLDAHPVSCTRTVRQIHEVLDANRLILARDKPHISAALEEKECA